MAVLRFITVGNGAQCVMITGILMMLMWCVVSWVSLEHPALLFKQSTVGGLVLSGWMMSIVKEEKLRCYSVLTVGGDGHLAVVIARMQVWSAFKIISCCFV